VLDTTDATRLAVSPTLAGIAKAETAVASQERISSFFGELQQAPTTPPPSPTSTPTFTVNRVATTATTVPLATVPMATIPVTTTIPLDLSKSASTTLTLDTGTTKTTVDTGIVTLATPTLYTPVDITDSAPVVGTNDIRTLSIAERLALPKAQEARDYSTASRHDAVLSLIRLADTLTEEDDGVTPGLFEGLDVYGLPGDAFLPEPTDDNPDPLAALRRPFLDFVNRETRSSLMSALLRPPVRENADEASHFSDSADMTDRSVALFRQVEARVKRYRSLITACETTLGLLRGDLGSVGLRERDYADALAEARHDVSVARALIAEEQARLDTINARRRAILEREVRFVAYQRPRATDDRRPAPLRPVYAGNVPAPLPACLQEHGDIPDALTDMLRVVREAPAAWFATGPAYLAALDRPELLLGALQTAQLRAPVALRSMTPTVSSTPSATSSNDGTTVARVYAAQSEAVGAARSAALSLSAVQLTRLGWQDLHATLARVVSLGDLIDGAQGRTLAARNAADFFERYTRVCACLHAGFSSVPAIIRLGWAETLSQFDAAPNLRNLASLSRFAELDTELRRRLQTFVDWLFDQIHPQLGTQEPRAVALVNDVVRMCLLLASHAPVGRIVSGRLPRPVVARPGLRIPFVPVQAGTLRIGMQAVVYRGETIVARAVVEDLAGGEALATVTSTVEPSVSLDASVRVQFSEPAQISLAAASAAFTLAR